MDLQSLEVQINEMFEDFKQGMPSNIPDEVLKNYLRFVLTH